LLSTDTAQALAFTVTVKSKTPLFIESADGAAKAAEAPRIGMSAAAAVLKKRSRFIRPETLYLYSTV
jgi:hypothetical protein